MIGKCDVCGKENIKTIRVNTGQRVCHKHYRQYRKFGKFLDNNPRTISDRNEYHICGDITYIDLYNINCEVVAQAIIDTEDLDKVKDIKWKLSTTGYAMNTQKGGIENRRPNLHMSRVIYGEDKLNSELFVDHINHNTLDNRKCNLRAATKSQNAMNSIKMGNPSNNIIPGVYLTESGSYSATIKHIQQTYYLGTYDTFENAAYARWIAEVLLFGEFQYNKTPPDIPIDDACLITLYVYNVILKRIEADIDELCYY